MHVTVNGVSSHLCKIVKLIIVQTYLQTEWKRYRITRRSDVTSYSTAKPPETSTSVIKGPKTHSFSTPRKSRNGLYNNNNANFSA